MRLPPVLSDADLPAPELCAARLDGDVFRLGDCFAPADEIEQPSHRAAAVHSGLSDRLIAEQLSAAWVWGALDTAPSHRQFCVTMGARVSHSAVRWMTLREVVIEPAEIIDLHGNAVTSPLRTVVDLVRFSDTFGAGHARAVARLVSGTGGSLHDAVAAIEGRRNLPNKRRALARLGRCALPAAEPPSAE